MIFLIEYDRATRHTLLFKTFKDEERLAAQDERLKLELELNRHGLLLDREVVLLEARDERHLRRTHDRYFEHLPEGVSSR
jgi:hypothetical protein